MCQKGNGIMTFQGYMYLISCKKCATDSFWILNILVPVDRIVYMRV